MIHTSGRALTIGFLSLICVSGAASAQTEVAIPQPFDPLLANLVIPADAHIKGLWSPLVGWDVNPIHMAVMPDGRVTTFGSSGLPGDENNSFGVKFDIWNPRRGFAPEAHRSLANVAAVDSFCSASTLLKTGELWTAGGRQVDSSYLPNDKTVVVNSERNAVGAGADMEFRRYYATVTTLADGRHLITGGSVGSSTTWAHEAPWSQQIRDDLSPTPEVFTQGGGRESLFGARSLDEYVNVPQSPFLLSNYDDDAFGPGDNRWWYPRQWVAPNGKVFGFSARRMWFLDPDAPGDGRTKLLGTSLHQDGFNASSKPNIGASSTAVMYDKGLILQVGGNGREESHDNFPSSELATIININSVLDIDNDTPDVYPAASLPPVPTPIPGVTAVGRQWANATALPDGRVLVTGGSAHGNSEADCHAARQVAIWNPAGNLDAMGRPRGSWTIGASASVPRTYHSSAVLLPNGAVLTGGGGAVDLHPGRLNVEVYYPPYLFQSSGSTSILASRPRVVSINALKFDHGSPIRARVSSGHTIQKAALIGLGSTTHSFDMGQRLYPVAPPALTVTGSDIEFFAPSQNHTPPGYYLFSVTNSNDVPSEGVIIAIGAHVAPPPRRATGPQFDVDGDGRTDLAIWRPRPGPSDWWISKSSGGTEQNPWGEVVGGVQDIPVPGDYDGDGKTDLAIWRPTPGPSNWWIWKSTGGTETLPWGEVIDGVQDIPVPGDYDGDGKTDLAIWRPRQGLSNWWIWKSTGGTRQVSLGGIYDGIRDIPVPGDYDGDGLTDVAVWRPRPGGSDWHIIRSRDDSSYTVNFGGIYDGVQDIPVPGDYDGDGRTDFAIWRPRPGASDWYIMPSSTFATYTVNYGGIYDGVQDIPVPGDYNGDGKTEAAIWRPRPGASYWYISTAGSPMLWGGIYDGIQDIPMPRR